MDIAATIAERKILEAMKRGELDNLPGMGKPLSMEEETAGIPAELRMAYKILKNAGFVPPEVELRREIVSLREMLDTLGEGEQRRDSMRKLNFKLLKLSMMRNQPLNLDIFPEYRAKVIERLIG